jgi:prepilin-type N-terminal cleavage/methylation domain-containing protein
MNIGVSPRLTFSRGFTLTELAVVLAIVGFLIGGVIMQLSVQDELRRTQDTQRKLAEARDALIGFASIQERLPCPAVDGATGNESYAGAVGASNCTVQAGFLPAATLGLPEVDASGYALDGWNQRLRYSVTSANGSAFVRTGAMRSTGLALLAPNLRVSTSAGGGTDLTTNAVVVIWSIGKNGPDPAHGGVSADESENPNPNSGTYPDPTADRFVSHEPAPEGATSGEFDDLVIWLSPNILFNRLIAAGRLP